MKRILFSILFLVSCTAYGQNEEQASDTVKAWKFGGNIGLAFSQVSLTNWAAGGDNSLSATGNLRLSAIYKKDKNEWENYFLTSYGLQKIGKDPYRKNEDKIEFISKYGHKLSSKWLYTANLNFRTQWNEGFKDKEDSLKFSDFFAPAYLTAALGLDFKPNANFALLLAPISTKFTFVADDSLASLGSFGVTPGDKFRAEFGGLIKLLFIKKGIIKNVDLSTNLDLFSNYTERPERIDVNWEVIIDMNINEFLTATFSTYLIYDYDVKFTEIDEIGVPYEKDKVQFKEILAVGLTYKF